jgi:hypothetical protein
VRVKRKRGGRADLTLVGLTMLWLAKWPNKLNRANRTWRPTILSDADGYDISNKFMMRRPVLMLHCQGKKTVNGGHRRRRFLPKHVFFINRNYFCASVAMIETKSARAPSLIAACSAVMVSP